MKFNRVLLMLCSGSMGSDADLRQMAGRNVPAGRRLPAPLSAFCPAVHCQDVQLSVRLSNCPSAVRLFVGCPAVCPLSNCLSAAKLSVRLSNCLSDYPTAYQAVQLSVRCPTVCQDVQLSGCLSAVRLSVRLALFLLTTNEY